MRFWPISLLVLAVLGIWTTLLGGQMASAGLPPLQGATPTFRPTRTPVVRSASPTVTGTRPLTITPTMTRTLTTPATSSPLTTTPTLTATPLLTPTFTPPTLPAVPITSTPVITLPAAISSNGRIAVIGRATVPTAPDRLEVEIALETAGTTPAEAFEENQVLAENVLTALSRAGVSRGDVRQVGYEVFTRAVDGQRGLRQPPPQGRRTTIIVQRLRFPVEGEERVGEIIEEGTPDGGERQGGADTLTVVLHVVFTARPPR
ncbi:MAG: SIMPL domain-containing protein [Ardenticatenia bacterium]|nr:SIMPL domain-containing protein [Ardenticatenia bacterium]